MYNINIIQNFEVLARSLHNKLAVIDGETSLTYGELLDKALNLAASLNSLADASCFPIAVFLPKCVYTVVCDIGITFSGNTYMNLDVKSPMSRIEKIIDRVKPRIIITNRDYIQALNPVVGSIDNIILIEDELAKTIAYDIEALMLKLNRIIDTDPYCIINTSGSTGVPKGVALHQKSFIDFYEWSVSTFDFNQDTIIGSLSPSFFDIYSFELSLLLLKGVTMVIIPDKLSAYPVKIIEWLEKYEVTFIFWVPTIMVNISNMGILDNFKLPKLNLVWFAGEVLPVKHLNYWRRNLQNARFVNLYGPIEITLDCVFYIVDREFTEEEALPIGIPCKNTDILILKDDNTLAAKNEIGELCVRGTSLALGYYNDKEKTDQAFVQNPLHQHYPELIYKTGDSVYMGDDGNIMFIGRKDFQIKHLGYRIELGEIETAILSLPFIDHVCVIYDNDLKEIVMYYETKSDLDLKIIRTELSKVLPKYMIPTRQVRLDKLPMNPNGKIDRQGLLAAMLKD